MSRRSDRPSKSDGDDRKDRLKTALKSNMAKRKAQAKAKAEARAADDTDDGAERSGAEQGRGGSGRTLDNN